MSSGVHFKMPPLKEILQEYIQFVSEQTQTVVPEDDERKLKSRLFKHLQDHRCLLVLDNFNTVLQSAQHLGKYRKEYEGYGKLLLVVGQTVHKSCLLLTSSEEPKEVAQLDKPRAHSFHLAGLGVPEAKKILKDRELAETQEDSTVDRLITYCYGGNPLTLKLAAVLIKNVFHGNVAKFLEGKTVMRGVEELLDELFQRLADEEKEVMYWLAIERGRASLDDLHQDIVNPDVSKVLPEVVDSLRRRSLIESNERTEKFLLQPAILKYVTDRFVERICQELEEETSDKPRQE